VTVPTPAPGRRRGALASLAGLAALAALAGVLAAALVASLGMAAYAAVDLGAASLVVSPLDVPQVAVPQASLVLAADGSRIATLFDENRTDVPLSAMSRPVQQAVVAVEDARFFQHGAVDPRGLIRAIIGDVSGHSVQGASTLTQQYVKNLLLEQAVASGNRAGERAATARTLSRKLRELRIAEAVEGRLSKQQILERYLDIVYFGEGAYGVQAAAERYFGVPAARLDVVQSATLAGLVQNPDAYDPVAHAHAAQLRRNHVLRDMLAQRMITPVRYAAAVATPVRVTGHAPDQGCEAAATSGFFCEYVVRSLISDQRYAALGATPADRERALLTGGLVIRTTLDPRTQAAAVTALDHRVPPRDRSHLGAAAVTVTPGTGAVVAMAENRTYDNSAGPGRTSVDYATDASLGGSTGFQTGSSFKPFTLATWLAGGGSLDDVVDATPRAFAPSDFTSCGSAVRGSQPYVPGNSEGTETGRMSLRKATADSVNVAYVDLETRLDLCDVAATAQSLGVHLAAPARPCASSGPRTTTLPTCLPSLTLGVEDVAPLTMAAAYAGFASGGTYCAPLPVTSVRRAAAPGRPAKTVLSVQPQCRQALAPDVASGVNTALESVLTQGTAAAVGPLPHGQSAGKTGTTNGPFDSWFVGYTAERSTAVWVGDPGHRVHGRFERRRLRDLDVGGRFYPTVFGASIAAPVWKALMTAAMRGLPPQPLP
jgi:membrane peptidoglycan carboxypeptidase